MSERLEEPASIVVSAVVVSVEKVAVPKTGEQGPSAVLGWVEDMSDMVC